MSEHAAYPPPGPVPDGGPGPSWQPVWNGASAYPSPVHGPVGQPAWAWPPATVPLPAGRVDGHRALLTLGAAAIVALGLVLAAVVGALVLGAAADDLGRSIGDSSAQGIGAWSAYPPDQLGPVEQSDPVAPGQLGADPVLDGYAADCFGGDLQACDDLYEESEPLSEYERYAMTCGGRVKPYDVYLCTELD